MGTTRNWCISLGLALAVSLTISGESAAGDSTIRLEIAVYIYNYARVDQKTLAEAEKVAARIFEKSEVETRWVEVDFSAGAKPALPDKQTSVSLSYIQLDVLTREMFDRLGLSNDVMGLALGAGSNRKYVYVSSSRANALFFGELSAQARGIPRSLASRGQILGHIFAHEMGHLLLNTANHSSSGIMRGVWDSKDLNDATSGRLVFSAEQSEILRAEVFRRASEHEGITTNGEETARLIR
jgi:hypothetical protein